MNKTIQEIVGDMQEALELLGNPEDATNMEF